MTAIATKKRRILEATAIVTAVVVAVLVFVAERAKLSSSAPVLSSALSTLSVDQAGVPAAEGDMKGDGEHDHARAFEVFLGEDAAENFEDRGDRRLKELRSTPLAGKSLQVVSETFELEGQQLRIALGIDDAKEVFVTGSCLPTQKEKLADNVVFAEEPTPWDFAVIPVGERKVIRSMIYSPLDSESLQDKFFDYAAEFPVDVVASQGTGEFTLYHRDHGGNSTAAPRADEWKPHSRHQFWAVGDELKHLNAADAASCEWTTLSGFSRANPSQESSNF